MSATNNVQSADYSNIEASEQDTDAQVFLDYRPTPSVSKTNKKSWVILVAVVLLSLMAIAGVKHIINYGVSLGEYTATDCDLSTHTRDEAKLPLAYKGDIKKYKADGGIVVTKNCVVN